jgi:hypothetical protein
MPEPTPENEELIKAFSTAMKLEPFQRGMRELAPMVWLTALRKVQNPNRAGLDLVSHDGNFGALKVSPVFHWSDARDGSLSQGARPARTSGTTSIPPRPTRSANAACTPRGAGRRSRRGLASRIWSLGLHGRAV